MLQSLDFIRDGGTLLITKIDRRGRSTANFLAFEDQLEGKGVGLRVLDFRGVKLPQRLVLVARAYTGHFLIKSPVTG